MKTLLFAILGSFAMLLITACSASFSGSTDSSPAAPEPAYKTDPTIYDPSTNPIYIKVLTKYRYRSLYFDSTLPYNSSSSPNGLSTTIADRPIIYAEFRVYDGAGNQIQQGETDASGYAIFAIPRTLGTYALKVYSRSLNAYVKVSVLNDIYNNQPYSATKNFSISAGNIAGGTSSGSPYTGFTTLYAEADENASAAIEGGAFNILYDIYLANEYIRAQTSRNVTPSTSITATWWVANKVTVYWKAGFNPYSYIDASAADQGVSFYSRGTDNLFILGGISGDVKSSDTDHFDDSIILHEYGHFLEDNYGNTQSPGGSHDGNFIIDPRLAWSEGWANYFQAAVLSQDSSMPASERQRYYIDTFGYKSSNSDLSAGLGVVFNLAQDASLATKDNISGATAANEGNFREVSISRTLYKTTRAQNVNYTGAKKGGGITFTEIWKTFSGELSAAATSLVNTALYPFPSVGAFNYLLNINTAVADKTPWTAILTEEKQPTTQLEYGQIVSEKVASCTRSMTGIADAYMYGSSLPRSNQLRNNDFVLYYYDGSGKTINLNFTQTAAPTVASYQMNLDLYIYYFDYVYFEEAYLDAGQTSAYLAKYKRTAAPSTSESISMAGLPAGYYVVNVKVASAGHLTTEINGTATYDLKIGTNYLCP